MQVDIGKDTLYKVRPLKILFNMNHPDYWVGPFFLRFVIITHLCHMEHVLLCGIQKVIFLINFLVAETE